MSLNREDDLYYFDVNITAEKPGAEFDPGPWRAVHDRQRRCRSAGDQQGRLQGRQAGRVSGDYVNRLDRSLSEKSMVSNRGIAAVVGESIPEVSSLAVIGFADPEMQRDVITGGDLGPALVTPSTGLSSETG